LKCTKTTTTQDVTISEVRKLLLGRVVQALSHLEERLLSRRELARQRLGAFGRSLEAKRCVYVSQSSRLPTASFSSE